jgi:hypothetical protein
MMFRKNSIAALAEATGLGITDLDVDAIEAIGLSGKVEISFS